MDYLVCEESNAELLQFFTWFCHYVERWSELPPKEKTPSPPWKPPNPVERSRTNLSIHTHRRAGSDRLDQILEILDRRSASDNTGGAPGQIPQEINSDARDVPTPRRFSAFQTAQLQLSRSNRLRKQVTVVENTAENLGKSTFARVSGPGGLMACYGSLMWRSSEPTISTRGHDDCGSLYPRWCPP